MVERRQFLKQVAAGSAIAFSTPPLLASSLKFGMTDKHGEVLPTRIFGKTGEKVTIYCMGGYHVAMAESEKESQEIIEKGIEVGIRFFETARIYAGGRAETLYGKYLIPKYRDQIFLATKNDGRNASQAKRQLDESLRQLKCDVIDLYYMHQIQDPEDVDHRLSEGVLDVMLEAQQQGKVRYLGFTGHHLTSAFRRIMEHVSGNDPFVAIQMPVNPVDANKPDSFTKEFIPYVKKHNYAIMAMKPFAQGRFFAKAAPDGGFWETDDPVIPKYLSVEDVFHFVLSQPITSLVNGTDRVDYLINNVKAIKSYVKLSLKAQQMIVDKVSRFAMTEGLERYRPKPGTY